MVPRSLIAALAVVAVANGAGPAGAETPRPCRPLAHRPAALEGLALEDPSGRPVALAAYRGRVLVLDAWTTWRPVCLRDAPAFLAATRRWRARGVEALLVAIGEPAWRVARALRERGWTAPLALDPSASLARLGVVWVPTALVFPPDQTAVFRLAGPRRWDDDAVAQWLAGLVRERDAGAAGLGLR